MLTPLRSVPVGWLRNCPWLPAVVRLGDVLVGPTGEVVRVSLSGRLELIIPSGHPHPGVASDPDPGERGQT